MPTTGSIGSPPLDIQRSGGLRPPTAGDSVTDTGDTLRLHHQIGFISRASSDFKVTPRSFAPGSLTRETHDRPPLIITSVTDLSRKTCSLNVFDLPASATGTCVPATLKGSIGIPQDESTLSPHPTEHDVCEIATFIASTTISSREPASGPVGYVIIVSLICHRDVDYGLLLLREINISSLNVCNAVGLLAVETDEKTTGCIFDAGGISAITVRQVVSYHDFTL